MFVKWEKVSPPSALYRKRNWVEVIPLKILREMPVIRFASHRRIQGIERYLEHLMRYRGLRSIRNDYGTRKKTLSRVETKGARWIYFSNIKTPLFSSNRKGKPDFEGLLWGHRPKHILGLGPCPRKHNGPRIDQQPERRNNSNFTNKLWS